MAKKGLGKGLGSFFDSTDIPEIEENPAGIEEMALSEIEPNKDQPRKSFDKEKISSLAQSIKEQGIIQPIVVTKRKNGRYMIVAGERRWRAAREAGLKKVPVIKKEYTDSQIAQLALIENLQREDLNPIEEAQGYKTLLEKFSMTQEDVSRVTGKSRSAVANSIRLLTLENDLQKLVASGEISSGHARALLSIENRDLRNEAVSKIINEGLNVRQAELLAKQLCTPKKGKKKQELSEAYKIEIEGIEKRLSSNFGTKVKISHTPKKGRIEIEYYGDEDLERILGLINM